MSKLAIIGMVGTSGMIALQADPALDPAVAALRDELMKTLPTIAGAKAQMEGIVGKAIGPETLLLALFIVFCGRGVMLILHKVVEEWQLTRAEARARVREDRERVNAYPRLAAPSAPQSPQPAVRAIPRPRATQSEAN